MGIVGGEYFRPFGHVGSHEFVGRCVGLASIEQNLAVAEVQERIPERPWAGHRVLQRLSRGGPVSRRKGCISNRGENPC